MARQRKTFQLVLRGTSADAVVATLERLGAIRSEARAVWLYPSLAEPRISFDLHLGSVEDTARLGLGMSIGMRDLESAGAEMIRDGELVSGNIWALSLAISHGISYAEALELILHADAGRFALCALPAGQQIQVVLVGRDYAAEPIGVFFADGLVIHETPVGRRLFVPKQARAAG